MPARLCPEAGTSQYVTVWINVGKHKIMRTGKYFLPESVLNPRKPCFILESVLYLWKPCYMVESSLIYTTTDAHYIAKQYQLSTRPMHRKTDTNLYPPERQLTKASKPSFDLE